MSKTATFDQPTNAPTRKVAGAVTASTLVTIVALVTRIFGIDFELTEDEALAILALVPWVPTAVAYFRREARKYAPPAPPMDV